MRTNLADWLPARHRATRSAGTKFDAAEFTPALKTRLLILQPTPFCNLRCDYCYLPDRDSHARMDFGVVRAAAKRLQEDGLLGEALTVVWHAGEPLAAGRAFYETAFAEIREAIGNVCDVSHSMQTNASLIDARWCDLFRRHRVRVGVSVDGPAELHDAHRRTRNGRGSHELVLRGMRLLREHDIDFHAIAVVTAATLRRAPEFFDFFLQHDVRDVGCNFDEVEGGHRNSSLAGCEDAHAEFLAYALQRSLDSDGRLRVREIANAFQLVAQPLPNSRWRGRDWPDNAQVLPFALLSVGWNGDFCTFSPELLGQPSVEHDNFVLGNVLRDGYLAATRKPAFQQLWSAIAAGREACAQQCAYFDYCGGGSPVNKLFENGALGSAETLYCRSMIQRPFDVVLGHLELGCEAGMPLHGLQMSHAGEERR